MVNIQGKEPRGLGVSIGAFLAAKSSLPTGCWQLALAIKIAPGYRISYGLKPWLTDKLLKH